MVTAGSNVTLTATASDSGGSIAKVEFHQGTSLVGTDTTSPYSLTWTSPPAGTYTLTAKATDNLGATTTSAARTLIVNAKPTVSLTAPANNAVVGAGSAVTLTANAADSDGTLTKVDFYRGTTLIASDTTAPYGATWSGATAGTYSLTAKATDNRGAVTTSAPVSLKVNTPPTVSLTSPANGSSVAEGSAITLAASAADADGGIAKVEFYSGANLLASVATAPYTTSWTNAAVGSHSLTAKATDSQGASTTSAAVTLTVTEAPATTLYYIDPDHLGTPRDIADETGKTVWRWVALEPFGDSAPEVDPDGDGRAFTFNLRFPGQYFDAETGMHYNHFRDYDPGVGRYVESDPIGLAGGLNLYGYVNENPINFIDPFGLANTRPGGRGDGLDCWGMGGGGGGGFGSRGGPPRNPKTGSFTPLPEADGPHTTLGTRNGRTGTYRQGATFDENGSFLGRTDVTNHNRGAPRKTSLGAFPVKFHTSDPSPT